MRILHFFIASWLLTNAALASACHSVGDVHVICSAQGLETVYVESPQTRSQARPSADCCPSAPIAVWPPLDFTPIHPPRATTKLWLSWPHHALRLDSAAAPRAPPHFVSF